MKNYYSDSAKMLEIINQLSTCLCENHDNFCKEFFYYLEKNIEIFIYVRNTEFFLLVYNVQNIIFNYS